MHRFFLAVVLLGLPVALAFSCQPSWHRQSDADIEFLASDAHVVVGGVPLVLPFVALPDYVSMGQFFSLNRRRAREDWRARRDAFRAVASDPGTAPTLNMLKVLVRTYGWSESDRDLKEKLCPRLTRDWAKSVCGNTSAPLRQALPVHGFFLADDRKFDAFDYHSTVGKERRSDQLRAMRLRPGEASIACDQESSSTTRSCTAAIPIKRHLIAVWSVWDSENETPSQQAMREGKAIAAFALHALGPVESFPELVELSCELRRPGSRPGPKPTSNPCGN